LKYQAVSTPQHPLRSRSLRARGLKYKLYRVSDRGDEVALFTGAWIEMGNTLKLISGNKGRALYGRVD